MPPNEPTKRPLSRREFITGVGRGASLLVLGGAAGALGMRWTGQKMVWQIDPFKCTQCGQCATKCVLVPSATKCVHDFPMCGYCKICFGFFRDKMPTLDSGAENQMCPTGAIRRTFVEEPYFQYEIDEKLCTGCGKCVKGCKQFGNGSLYLQVRHDRCLNCNECSIAAACPADAFVRLPADRPYVIQHEGPEQLQRAVPFTKRKAADAHS